MPANDLLTETEARSYLHLGATSAAPRLASLITAISTRLDELIGPTVTRACAERVIGPGDPRLVVDQYPLVVGQTITVTDLTTSTALTVGRVDYTRGVLSRPARQSWPDNELQLAYTAGRVADTAAVPALIKEAAGITLAAVWRFHQIGVAPAGNGFDVPTAVFPTFAVPKAARELLQPELAARRRTLA